MKPLLLVDVDGVLCPFGHGNLHSFDGHVPFALDRNPDDTSVLDAMRGNYPGYEFNEDYYVHVSQDNADRLARLSEKFELVWCTGWQEKANEVIGPLHNLPQLPVVQIKTYSSHIHWKHESIEEFVGDRPYAFIDDDIGADGIAYARWRNRKIPTLWLKINCSEGLTERHTEQLEEFADSIMLTAMGGER